MAFKMYKIANFVFSADNCKKLVTVWAICLSIHGRSYWVIAENGTVNSLWLNCLWDIVDKYQKDFWYQTKKWTNKYQNPVLLNVEVLLMLALKCILQNNFLKGPNKSFQMHLNIFPKLGLIFCCIQQKVHKMSHFWHFNDHNSGSKHS